MLTPLPGSRDHVQLLERGVAIDEDLNRYDSFHATTEHSRMSRTAWQGAYQQAWDAFYSVRNMTAILRRVSPQNYWAVFANFIWYKHSMLVEGGHPMIHGFVRLKGRRQRRSELPRETRWRYVRRRWQDVCRYARLWPRLAMEMEEVWLQTRHRSAFEQRVIEELRRMPSSVRGWRRMRASEIQAAYRRAVDALHRAMPAARSRDVRVPPRLWLWVQRWNPWCQALTWSRHSLTRFWRRCASSLRRGRLDRLRISSVRGPVQHGHRRPRCLAHSRRYSSRGSCAGCSPAPDGPWRPPDEPDLAGVLGTSLRVHDRWRGTALWHRIAGGSMGIPIVTARQDRMRF
jgi:hypothetical protein